MTILEGSTFCICDDIGDLGGETSGFFAEDTRFLSRLELFVNGERPLLLSSGKVEYFSAAFYLRNPVVEGLVQDTLSIVRERFVGRGLQDHLVLRNEGTEAVAFELTLEVGTDFADIISVKEHDFALGDPANARPLPPPAAVRYDPGGNQLVLEEGADGSAKTQVLLSKQGEPAGAGMRFQLQLAPREEWDLRLDVVTVARRAGDSAARRRAPLRRGARARAGVALGLEPAGAAPEHTRATISGSRSAQSVADLASLRMRDGELVVEQLPAAGMPWFMTVFGRDTLITGLQTMLLGPELAIASLAALTKLQAQEDDPSIDAEPGKIVHELRRGRAAETWFGRYYGTVDATPLFLVLLGEVWRWTADAELAERYREPALAALRWIDEFGDRDGDGFVEYERRSARGLENQSWKDSGDSQRFHDGSFARTPIAPCEVQGYVYDAKLRMAQLARDAWGDEALADRLEAEAAELRRRFDEAVLGRGPGRLLRARARRRQAARRLALLERRPPPLERDRAAGASAAAVRAAARGRALVRLGDQDDVAAGRRPQPAQLPQRHRLAPRHVAGRVGARPRGQKQRRAPDRRLPARRRPLLRLVAAGGVRRLPARPDALPDRLPDRRPAAGVGRRDAGAAAAAAARAGAERRRPGSCARSA